MNAASKVASKKDRSIESLWRAALLLAIIVQLFILALQTAGGRRVIPAAMIRMHFIQPRAGVALVNLVHPSGIGAVEALATQIQAHDRDRQPVVALLGDHSQDRVSANLAYRIYPRLLVRQFVGATAARAPASPPAQGCVIHWPSIPEITLVCPESTWHYDGGGVSP